MLSKRFSLFKNKRLQTGGNELEPAEAFRREDDSHQQQYLNQTKLDLMTQELEEPDQPAAPLGSGGAQWHNPETEARV